MAAETEPTASAPAKPSRRLLLVPLLVLILMLLGLAVFGERGLLRALHALQQKEELQGEIRKLEETNAALQREIEALRRDQRYLERIARKELGLVREDELVYQFPDSGEKRTPEPPPPPSAAAAAR
jgi:cell division protein FtsL